MIPKHQREGFKVFLKDKRKKTYPKIITEFLALWKSKREMPLYYFKYLYRRGINNIDDYLSTKEAAKIQKSPILHRAEYMAIMSNKLVFSLFCKHNGVPTPELVSYNFGPFFYFKSKTYRVSNNLELASFFNEVFKETKKERLFLKPFSLFGGRGACIIRKSHLKEDLSKNADGLLSNDYIHESVLVQHDDINKINSSCINTLRIETYIDKNQKIHIVNVFMRFGIGDNIVDNGHSGGIYIGIDKQSGALKEIAMEEAHFGGKNYHEHPNSAYPFKGFIVPYFKESCDLVIKATEFLPDRYIGWDVAITNEGPVIIEANEYPDLFMSDTAYGGYLKNPLIREILAEAS